MSTMPSPSGCVDSHKKDVEELAMVTKQSTVDKAFDLEHFQQQISTLPSDQAIQVPAGVLCSMINSMVNLKQQVIDLKSQVTNFDSQVKTLQTSHSLTSHDIASLQSYNSMTFVYFPRLPTEIKQMIWRTFLEFPRIICLKSNGRDSLRHEFKDPSSLRSLMLLYHVCRESRGEVFKKLGFGPTDVKFGKRSARTCLLHEYDVCYRTCDHSANSKDNKRYVDELVFNGTYTPHIALRFDIWYEWIYHNTNMEELLETLNSDPYIASITLVIGSLPSSEQKDVIFMIPRVKPAEALGKAGHLIENCGGLEAKVLDHMKLKDWAAVEKDWEDMMIAGRQTYRDKRQALLDGKHKFALGGVCSLVDRRHYRTGDGQ